MNCTLGTADASGLLANVDRQLSITTSLGITAAGGFTAIIDQQLTISATPATANADGFLAQVDRQYTVAGILAIATAAGFNANIDQQIAISGSLGQAIADGFLATVGTGVTSEYSANENLYADIGSNLSIMLGVPGIPSWNTAGRPVGNFKLGYNTQTGKLELYNGSAWVGVTIT